jgi:ketosteroid isomerase-like protein
MQTATISPVDTAAIRSTIGPWTKSAVDRDWDAFLALCTNDVVFMQPDGATIESTAARSWLESYPIIKRFEFDFDQIEGQGDLAYGRGGFRMTVEVDGSPAEVDGKFVDIFRRDAQGEWKYAVVIWNSNTPIGGA